MKICANSWEPISVMQICTVLMQPGSTQVLDGQAVSDQDRAAAADYSTRQAQLETAAPALDEQDSNISPAASLKPSRAAAAAALPSRPSLPSSPHKGLHALKAKSTGSRQKNSGDTAPSSAVASHKTVSAGVDVGFEGVADQLPKFDIDKHGNRLDKPLDPYGAYVPLTVAADSQPCCLTPLIVVVTSHLCCCSHVMCNRLTLRADNTNTLPLQARCPTGQSWWRIYSGLQCRTHLMHAWQNLAEKEVLLSQMQHRSRHQWEVLQAQRLSEAQAS